MKTSGDFRNSWMKQRRRFLVMPRGQHIGSNKGTYGKAQRRLYESSSTRFPITFYGLPLATGREIPTSRIWRCGQEFQSPNMKKDGGFCR